MNTIQKELLQLLIEFDLFCKKNNLQYCLMWGTLLGAVRHKGFIPWDDDIDIAMDIENFQKLKQLASQNELPLNMEFQDSFYTKGCRIPKVRKKDSLIKDKNGATGIFIDIFPFNRYTELDAFVLRVAAKGLKIRDYKRKIQQPLFRAFYNIFSFLPYLAFIATRYIFSKKQSCENGNYIGRAVITNVEFFFKVDDFFPFTKAEFEGHVFNVPRDSRAILTECYGNWREPIDNGDKHF